MTVKQRLRRNIFFKSLILFGIAVILGALCYYASSHESMPDYDNAHLLYTLASVGLSLGILVFIAWKIRYFHDIFSKELTGLLFRLKEKPFALIELI